MQNRILLLIIMSLFFNCSVKEKPVLISIEDIQLVTSTTQTITLKANAIFENPNNVGGSLESDNISVFVNDIKVAQVASEAFKVPAKKEFTVPLKVRLSTDSIINNNKALGSLLSSILKKQIKVQYKGDIIYKTFGFSYTYPVDETELVNIKF